MISEVRMDIVRQANSQQQKNNGAEKTPLQIYQSA